MKSRRPKACPKCSSYIKLKTEPLGDGIVRIYCPRCEWEDTYMERRRFKNVYLEEEI